MGQNIQIILQIFLHLLCVARIQIEPRSYMDAEIAQRKIS